MSMQHAGLILHVSSDSYTTIRGKALLRKLTVDSSLARKFPRHCRARRFTTVFTRVSPTPRVTFRIVPCSSLRWLDASPRPCSRTENHPRAGFFLKTFAATNSFKCELKTFHYYFGFPHKQRKYGSNVAAVSKLSTLSMFTELQLQMAMSADWGKWQRLKEIILASC
jgi:hypothetical protein